MADIKVVTSVTEFIDALDRIDRRRTSILTFRGQRNSAWTDDPAILRQPSKLLPFEYNAIRDLHAIQPQEFLNDRYMFDKLVRMQHYGLPTRLLDVTSNPLVALYFATEPYRSKSTIINGRVLIYDVPEIRRKYSDSDSISCVANLANLSDMEKADLLANEDETIELFNELASCDRLVQFIKEEKSYFRPRIDPSNLSKAYFVYPKMQNRRTIAQHGAFIIFGLKIRRTARKDNNDNSITRNIIDIPQDSKSLIRRQLDSLGINNSTLFPELDQAANDIVRRYTQ